MTTAALSAPPGATSYFGSMLATLHFWGYASDLNVPAGVIGSFELNGNEGAIVLDAIKGDKGDPGTPSDIVKMQYEDNFSDASQLPSNLENIDLDIGKAWWIGNVVWMWSGTTWYQKQMGTPGPVGPPPALTASAELVASGVPGTSLTQPVEVTPSTSNGGLNVNLLFKFDHDSIMGPDGPSGPIRDAADYDNSVAPNDMDSIVWNASLQKFAPFALNNTPGLRVYSVPENFFQPYTGIGTGQNICAFPVPPQPWPWKPIVLGHIYAIGAELAIPPLIIGCEVLLGQISSGQLIGRGFGNIANYAWIMPHFSRPTDSAKAITPDNSVALVPAWHTTPAQGTVYVNLSNDGAVGGFIYNTANSQLVVAAVQCGPEVPNPAG